MKDMCQWYTHLFVLHLLACCALLGHEDMLQLSVLGLWVLQVQEVGDGNINFVYIVTGPNGAVCLKQGLPFVRIAQDWPLTQASSWPCLYTVLDLHCYVRCMRQTACL